jgi:DNA-binding NarL/FixJ family response regulator
MSSTALLIENKPTVLIVDDNLPFVNRIVHLLSEVRNIGDINVAAEYDEAARIFEEQKPNVVLLDISMPPGKSGVELLKQIKQSENDSRVIMLTNHADDFYKNYCYELGVDYFLDKSNDFTKVPVIISLVQSRPAPLRPNMKPEY